MELKLQTQPAPVCQTVLDLAAGQPIEADLLLPDYCPDIVRVLTCRAEARVTQARVSGAALAVEGETVVTLLYLGEVGGVCRSEVRQPFQKRFDLPCECGSPLVFASAWKESISCRAVSRRRVEVQGALTVRAVVCDAKTQPVLCGSETPDLCLHTVETAFCCLRSREEQTVTLMEMVSPPPGAHLPREILRADCAAVLQDWATSGDGIAVRGELCVSLLASTGEGALETQCYTLPVSRRFPVGDAQAVCDVSLACEAISCTCADEDDDPPRTTVELTLRAAFLGAAEETIPTADDCFSIAGRASGEEARLETVSIAEPLSERCSLTAAAPLPEGADTVLDAFGVPSPLRFERREDGAYLTGSVRFAALVSGGESGISAVSAAAPIEIALPETVEGTPIVQAQIALLSTQAAPQGSDVAWTGEALVSGVLLAVQERTALVGASVDETQAAPRDPAVGLRVYYAEAGESVWEIARGCGALPQAVAEDNGLEEEVLAEPRVLLIPAL